MKSIKRTLVRHVAIGLLSAITIYLFWLSRPEWVADMRLWRAVGDASFVFLALTLALGPLAKLWKPSYRLLRWRRELGIWFAILAVIHSILILDGWVQWNAMKFFGYEYVEQLGRYARIDPGFGLANLLGLIATFWAVILAATSSDRVLRFLGGASWKWLHYSANIIFYLVSVHVLYFMFIHYTISFHRSVPDPNWFRYPFLAIVVSVFLIQISAFIKTVAVRRKLQSPNREHQQEVR